MVTIEEFCQTLGVTNARWQDAVDTARAGWVFNWFYESKSGFGRIWDGKAVAFLFDGSSKGAFSFQILSTKEEIEKVMPEYGMTFAQRLDAFKAFLAK